MGGDPLFRVRQAEHDDALSSCLGQPHQSQPASQPGFTLCYTMLATAGVRACARGVERVDETLAAGVYSKGEPRP